MKQPWETFGGLLRDHRRNAGMTQRELASRAGVSVRALRDIEHGRVGRPRVRSARRLAAAVGGAGDHGRLLAAADAAAGETRLAVSVLGPLTVHHDDVPVDLRSPKLRCLLGLFAIMHGQVVPLTQIVDALWGDRPPKTCLNLVHTYVGQLRAVLEPGRRRGVPAQSVVLDRGGYRPEFGEEQLDLIRFDRLTQRGRAAQEAGDLPAAEGLYGEALGCWRGRILADLDPHLRQHPAAVAASGRRIATALSHADVATQLGNDEQVAVLLRALADEEPMHEGVHARLMLALARSGQQAAALEIFAAVRVRLVEDLGIEPGRELREAHLRVLRQDLMTVAPPPEVPPSPAGGQTPLPAQLPADVAAFTGRVRHLQEIDAVPPGVPVIAIVGSAGMGKTALAVHWAHRVRERYPDGQLYVDLRGYAPGPPMCPAEALAALLRAVGVPAARVPVRLDEAVGLYRSLVADRRLLVVLDNARDADQVRPLLPGGTGCLALVTSRHRLSGLEAREGARRLVLDVLEPAEATALLARLLGADRIAREPEAAADLAAACAGLPLALRIAAANLTSHPYDAIADHVVNLRDGSRLAALAADGDGQAAVRVAFDLSYATLAPSTRRLFRCLGLVPGVDITAAGAAALAGTTVPHAREELDRLAAAHLVGERAQGRFGGHDLLRLYARERGEAEDPPLERDAATGRLFDYYRRTVDAAARRLYPDMLRLPETGESAEVAAPAFEDHAEALAWLDAELANVVAMVRYAADHGPRSAAWLLADALRGYFWARMYTVDWFDVTQSALRAAAEEPYAQAAIVLSLGDLHMRLGRYKAAAEHYNHAMTLTRKTGWRKGEVAALCNLGVVHWQTGRLRQAAEHFTRAQTINLDTGRLEGQAATLGNLGLVYRELGLLAEAADHYTQAQAISHRMGSRMGEAIELANAGEAWHLLGDLDCALDHLERALVMHREVGDRDTEADTLQRIAAVRRDGGRYTAALTLGRAALALAVNTGNLRVEADAANTLGTILHDIGSGSEAMEHHQRALDLARQTGDRYPEGQALLGLAAAHQQLGDLDRAAAAARRVLRIARRTGYRIIEGQALVRIAAICLAQGRAHRAQLAARQAVELCVATGHRHGQAQARRILDQAAAQR